MNEKFFDLKKEKQDRIINGALKVFARNGYRHASTDEIIMEAQISKGLLFHYFGSKIGLYAFLYDYCGRFLGLELKSVVSDKEKDYFKIMQAMEDAKLAVLKNYPYLQLFIDSLQNETADEALDVTLQMRNELQSIYDKFLDQVDPSPFRHNVDAASIHTMLTYTLNGIMCEHLQATSFNAEAYHSEATKFINMVRLMSY